MEQPLRTFIAVKINPEPKLLKVLDSLKKSLSGEPVKWVDSKNLHLTLKFLGETDSSLVNKVGEKLELSVQNLSIFSIGLSGLGFFKNKTQPRVLFTKVEGFEPLQQLNINVTNELQTLGFESETRKFKPHLTLARIKFINDLANFYKTIENYREEKFQQTEIREIIFYRSILNPTGPVYKPLKIIPLNS